MNKVVACQTPVWSSYSGTKYSLYSFGLLYEIHLIVSSYSLFYLKQYYQQESAKLRNQIQMLQNTNR